MIWYVCFTVVLLLLGLALRIAFHRDYGELRVGVILLVLLAAAYVAYLPIFAELYDVASTLLGDLINTLRIISLDAYHLEYYDCIIETLSNGVFSHIYIIVLGVIHVLLPAVSALAAYTILMRCYAGFQLFLINRRKRPLYILSEWNKESAHLARSIREADRRSDIVFANCQEKPQNGQQLHALRYVFHGDSITDLVIRHSEGKDVYYFCIGEDEDRNLNEALHLIQSCTSLKKGAQARIHVVFRSQLTDVDTMLDSTQKGSVDIRILNESEEIAYDLLRRHPLPYSARDHKINLLLVGMGDVNQCLLRAAVWCGQLDGYQLEIHVAGEDVAEKKNTFCARYPALAPGGRYNIHFHPCSDTLTLEQTLRERCNDATYIVVECGNDSQNIEQALRLRRLYYQLDPQYSRAPLIFVHTQSTQKLDLVSGLQTSDNKQSRRVSYQLTPFGNLETVYSYNNLVNSELEALAKNVHLVYSDIFSDGKLNVEDALEQYNLLEVKKRSNRANAMHIRYKLALLGLDYTEDSDAEEVPLERYLTPERLERLTYSEHDRWMAFLESEGWQSATIQQVKAYQAAGLSPGRHESALLKMHPFICDFYELPARSEALHQKDSTIYDEQLIARIPDILHDRWGVSGRKYRIIQSR